MLIPIREIISYTEHNITGLLISLGYDNDKIIGIGHQYFNLHVSKEKMYSDEGYSTVIPALIILKNLDLEDFDKIIIGFDKYKYKGLELKYKYDRKIRLFNSIEICSILNPSLTLIKSFINKINDLIQSETDLNFHKRYIVINNLFGTMKKESSDYNSYETTVNFNILNFNKDKFLVESYDDIRKLRKIKY
jgi:hypothetical protein